MVPTSQHMLDIIYNYKMSRNKPQKMTYSQVSNTRFYQWDNCVMMTALPFVLKTVAKYTTKTTNQSSQASEIRPQDYTNKLFLHTTITPSTRDMPPHEQPTYKNTTNIFTNVVSPQPPEHGSKLLKRATSNRGPVLLSRLSNDTYQNQKQPQLDIWTNKEKNLQSTKQSEDDQDTMHTLSPLEQGLSTHALYAATICYNEPTGKLYTDLTGRFPVQSSRGHKYVLVTYNFDSNSIHVKPLKSRHDNDTIKAYEEIYNMLTWRGLKPRLHWLDNEAFKALKNFIDKEQTKYQLTPPHIHQRNAAECAILTFKNHFISGLCSVDKKNSPTSMVTKQNSP